MNVYILFYKQNEDGELIVGVYSTKEKAEQARKDKEWPGFTPLSIEEYTLDGE